MVLKIARGFRDGYFIRAVKFNPSAILATCRQGSERPVPHQNAKPYEAPCIWHTDCEEGSVLSGIFWLEKS